VQIRFATIEDVPACIELTSQVYTTIYKPLESTTDQEWQEEIDLLSAPSDPFYRHTSQLIVAETDDKEIVGCVMIFPILLPADSADFSSIELDFVDMMQFFQIDSHVAYISRLYVQEQYRNKGIGKRLLQSAVRFFPSVEKLFLRTLVLNTNSVGFCEHLGFVPQYRWIQDGKREVVVFSIDAGRL
jgi:GNAT superfamily N-acetyltransferase